MTLADLAPRFGMTPSAMGYIVVRGEGVAKQKGFKLINPAPMQGKIIVYESDRPKYLPFS